MAKARLFDRVDALVLRLEDLAAAPARSRDERAVYDAWRIAVKPRAARMVRRARKLLDGTHWEFDAERRPERIRAASWNLVVREAAALYTELAGALAQHERTRITWSPKARFGIEKGKNAPVSTTKTKAKDRAAAEKALAEAREAEVDDAKKVLAEVEKRLAVVRKALGEALAELRHLVADLQTEEEDRLQFRIRALREGSADRETAEDLLLEMARGRLRAERHRSGAPGGWGSALRTAWLQPRAKLVTLVEGP